ncbi:hypothetical protein [Cryobacterium sp. PAMC25264]|uniref:hypothetical protein n=1 Tax=Cryobacterium sp. PAMC25264 TaxID=2861288 RepID=UPI001C62739B|nr:hypothetical protein [Cryobacterium sp. PAMC25264]QYF74872.1 hypothetical protein KY500_06980 [Cryobacterium sp. PAMC25264]
MSLTWRLAGAVAVDSAGYPTFPILPDCPGIYRFDFGIESGHRTLYIGEAKNLSKRTGQYRAAKRDRSHALTSRRLHLRMIEHLLGGGTITMAVTTEVTLGDGSSANLNRKSGRLLGESAAAVLAHREPEILLLNKDDELGIPEPFERL